MYIDHLLIPIVLLISGQFRTISCTDHKCWDVTDKNCIINAKFHNINSYDVHIKCTQMQMDIDGRDTGDRFGKVHHAELNGCLTRRYTNPFQLLPMNMNNLKKLTIKQFYIGELALLDSNGPYLPKLEELNFIANVITAYESDFFNAKTIKQLKNIQFAGDLSRTPSLQQLRNINSLLSLTIREGDVLLDYNILGQMVNLRSLDIFSSRISITASAAKSHDAVRGLAIEDSWISNSSILETINSFQNLIDLRIRNTASSVSELVSLDVQSVLEVHSNLSSLMVQKQNISRLTINLHTLARSQLKILDVSYNSLEDIDWQWNSSAANTLILSNKFKLAIDHNPWQCEFLQTTDPEQDLFEYERDYTTINVRGIKCKHNSTKGITVAHSRPLDMNNMWLLYGCVLSSLLLIISVTYLVCAICRSKPREPFYRSLVRWRVPAASADMAMRKLPPTTYETPLHYRTIEFKSDDNCEIYEEIPANATGQTIQIIM